MKDAAFIQSTLQKGKEAKEKVILAFSRLFIYYKFSITSR